MFASTSAASVTAKSVGSGKSWTVDHTIHLRQLHIAAGARLSAPAGDSLTLTVDGIGREIAPGTYTGDVVLTVTKSIIVRYLRLPPEHFRTAVYVNNGAYQPDRSVASEVVGGTVTDTTVSGISITSHQRKFNGIIVAGKSTYKIVAPKIELTGNGANDFDGFGAGIMSDGDANVTVDRADITTRGVVRGAIFVGGHSKMTIDNSTIHTYNGKLPPGYKFTLEMGKMLEVPWMLGIAGNARATLLVDNGTAYYNNDHIVAEGWGALSTDGVKKTRLYANNSVIETTKSGYGAYSIGDSVDRFSHCRFNVADMALIMANGGSGTFTDGTVVNSRRFGVVVHFPSPRTGTLRILGASVFNTKSTAIQVKGVAANIEVDDARLDAGNGIILQAMVNDDPFAPPPKAGTDSTVRVRFKNVALHGDIINSRTSQGGLSVTFDHATIAGAISTATAAPAKGEKPTAKKYYLIGDVKNTLTGTGGYGLDLSLGEGSTWTVTRTSYLSGLVLSRTAAIKAPNGKAVSMVVNGAARPILPGTYKGNVELQVKNAE